MVKYLLPAAVRVARKRRRPYADAAYVLEILSGAVQ